MKNIEYLDSVVRQTKISIANILNGSELSTDIDPIDKTTLAVILATAHSMTLEEYLKTVGNINLATFLYFLADIIATSKPGETLDNIQHEISKMSQRRGDGKPRRKKDPA